MIELTDLCFSYGDKEIFKDLSFTFPDQGVFAIMGRSGEGKTTLLRLLAGLEKPTAGKLESTHERIAFAFQEPRLLPWLNSAENLNFVLSKEMQKGDAAAQLLEKFELADSAEKLPAELSGGMKQRLSLARALAVGADLLLLDEPFSALDGALKERIAQLVKKANPNGLTVIVTHDKSDAELLGATVLCLMQQPVSTLTK